MPAASAGIFALVIELLALQRMRARTLASE